jgi:hypothetical protein
MVAIKDKVLDLGFLTNPSKLTGMINILGDHLRTDLEIREMKRLAEIMKKIDMDEIVSKVLDTASDGPLVAVSMNGYYIKPRSGNWKEVQMIAHQIFTDPYIKKESARLEILNGTSLSGKGLEVSNMLKNYGYNVVNLDMADKVYVNTVLYDYSNGKCPYTVRFLKQRYNAEVKSDFDQSKTGVDIVLIVGENYINDSSN